MAKENANHIPTAPNPADLIPPPGGTHTKLKSITVVNENDPDHLVPPTMSHSAVLNPALADHQAYTAQHAPSDTRSVRPHKSSTSNLHVWTNNTQPTPYGSSERDVNPDPSVFHYCNSHGWNLSHKGTTCAKLRATNATAEQNAATHPHATSPVGNRYVQSRRSKSE
jgi:hypothetical protein